jgi:hypothetical protein
MKRFPLLLLLAALLFLPACANYQAARNFSREEVNVQEKQLSALTAQFAAIEGFADASLAVTQWRLDEITGRIQDLYAKKARIALNKTDLTDDQKEAILKDMSASIAKESAQNETNKRRIGELVVQLKAKDADLLAAQAEILAASKQLDEWVQLKKVDELLLARLGDKLKGAQDKLIKAADGATSIWNQIRALLPAGSPVTTPLTLNRPGRIDADWKKGTVQVVKSNS